MMRARPRGTSVIVGRDPELKRLQGFVTDSDAWPSAVVLEGEAGIGKTTLWEAALGSARDAGIDVLTARPTEPDAMLAFSALGDLLEPTSSFRQQLPEPQRRALAVALLEEEGSGIDPRAVSAGVRSLLAASAASRSILVAIDDVQWIDPESERVLTFAFRRLGGSRIAALLTSRIGPGSSVAERVVLAFPSDKIERLALGSLDASDIADIVRASVGELTGRQLQEIHRESNGNPFFAAELALAVKRGDEPPAGLVLPLPRSLREDLLKRRLAGLSPATLEVLLMAAAATRPTIQLLRAAMPSLGVEAALDEAELASIIRLERSEIRFSHPLYRSSIYAHASTLHRHELHSALASVSKDPEERGRHLALSAERPGKGIAQAIERGAANARARGAPSVSADLMSHAIRLTPRDDLSSLTRRLLLAGNDRMHAGAALQGISDIARAVDLAERGATRAHALATLGVVEFFAGRTRESRLHLEAALCEPGVDEELRCHIHADLFWTLLYLEDLEAAAQEAERALELGRSVGKKTVKARAYAAAARAQAINEGKVAEALMREAPELWEPLDELPIHEWPRFSMVQELVALAESGAGEAVDELLLATEENGDELSRQILLSQRAELLERTGDWRRGAQAASEATTLAELSGDASYYLARQAWFEVGLGRAERGRELAERALELTNASPPAFPTPALGTLGVLELSLGRPMEALKYLDEVPDTTFVVVPGDPWLIYRVEALAAVGRVDEAEERVAYLEERAASLHQPYARTMAARGRGLVEAARGDLPGALSSLERALQEHGNLAMPFELARTLLVFGSMLRRAGQKKRAREALQQARAIFVDLGALLWDQRVEDELGHISGRVTSAGELTDAERRVAKLAAAGFRNREIAEQLFMSVRTVEGHLSHVYGKLSIRSRTELAVFLEDSVDRT
jgi:DNA-binding CsgD family transcriptional regulator